VTLGLEPPAGSWAIESAPPVITSGYGQPPGGARKKSARKGIWKRRYKHGVGTSYENVETGKTRRDPPEGARVVTEEEWAAEQAAGKSPQEQPPEAAATEDPLAEPPSVDQKIL